MFLSLNIMFLSYDASHSGNKSKEHDIFYFLTQREMVCLDV